MVTATPEANVLKMWTVLDKDSSDSGDELDQLAALQDSGIETPSPATKLLASKSLGSLQGVSEDADMGKPDKSNLLERSAMPQGNASGLESQWHDSKINMEQRTDFWRSGGVKNRTGSAGPPQRGLVHSRFASDHTNGSPHRQPTLANALSSAFMRNAELPYPEVEIKTLKAPSRQSRYEDAISALGGKRHQRNGGKAGLRRSRRHLAISQEEIDEYLDVNVSPVSLGAASTNVPDQDAEKASKLQENTVTAFNRRHVLRSISKSKPTPPPKPAWSATSRACFSESYTAAYLNRVSEWFGSESINQVAKIDDPLISIHPTPQIPRIRPAGPPNTGEVASSDESSFEDTRSATPTPTVSKLLVTGSVLNGTKRSAGELGEQLEYVEETKRPKTTGLSDVPETQSVQAHTILLETLLKGKRKLSEDEVKLIKKYLSTLERGNQTPISIAFEACRQEDKDAFMRSLSRLLELSDLGVSGQDDETIRKSAAAILKTYDAANH